jgi:hypothetical protein
MSTYSYVSFPASGVKAGMDNVLHSVANYVVGKFPHRVIRGTFVDTRDKMRSIYMNLYTNFGGDKNKILPNNIQEIRKMERPHLYIGYTFEGFETAETGLGEFPLLYYPNAYWFDEKMTSVFPILENKERHILLGTYNLRIRVTAEFIFSCQNKEEQVTIYVYLKNFIKEKYGHIIDGVTTGYVLPEVVITSLKNILYGKDTLFIDIEKDLDEYLMRNSNKMISPVWRDGKKNAKFYELSYIYRAIRFQLTGNIQLDDGDKKDMAYDNYTIRFPAICEFYVPINYVLESPELIPSALGAPSLIDDSLLIDSVPDENNNVQHIDQLKKDSRQIFYKEHEFKDALSNIIGVLTNILDDSEESSSIIKSKKDEIALALSEHISELSVVGSEMDDAINHVLDDLIEVDSAYERIYNKILSDIRLINTNIENRILTYDITSSYYTELKDKIFDTFKHKSPFKEGLILNDNNKWTIKNPSIVSLRDMDTSDRMVSFPIIIDPNIPQTSYIKLLTFNPLKRNDNNPVFLAELIISGNLYSFKGYLESADMNRSEKRGAIFIADYGISQDTPFSIKVVYDEEINVVALLFKYDETITGFTSIIKLDCSIHLLVGRGLVIEDMNTEFTEELAV